MADIKALTVKQPWAHMIAHGGKLIENRVWNTTHRGLLAIHAGTGWDKDAGGDPLVLKAWAAWAANAAPEVRAAPFGRKNPGLQRGAVIAAAELSDCHPAAAEAAPCSPWADTDGWHWRLASIRPLANPVPCRGMERLWSLPPDVAAAVRGQIG